MKTKKERTLFLRTVAVLAVVMACGGSVVAQPEGWDQSNDDVCPGWNNPMAFQQGVPGHFFWNGQTGKKVSGSGQTPDPLHGVTGMTSWGSLIAAGSLETTTLDAGSYPSCDAQFPQGFPNNRAFALYNVTNGGSQFDPNTNNRPSGPIRYVPTQFNTNDSLGINTQLTRSIRIGDACGGTNATALYYNMEVNSQNAMLFIYYACVIQAPGHGTACDPAFIIRVMRQKSNGTWEQVSPTNTPAPTGQQCDTLCYMVPSTPAQGQSGTSTPSYGGWGTVQLGQAGWEGAWSYGAVVSKDWEKVSLNLSSLMYQNVRVEVLISDCCMTAHYAYAYVAGECRPMEIQSSGCPPGESTDVTTLTAPRGLQKYVWYASNYGYSNPTRLLYPGNANSYFTFRLVSDTINNGTTEADTAYRYRVKSEDFRVLYRPHPEDPNASSTPVDSIGERQTFCCTMTSALDPAKPFESNLYVNVTNTKPSMQIDTLSLCGGDIKLRNRSEVPGNPSLVNGDSTIWTFYNNAECLGDPDTVMYGDSIRIHYTDALPHGVLVRTNIDETLITSTEDRPAHNACYSEATYQIKPIQNPQARMSVSQRVLCDDGQTTLSDITSDDVTHRIWAFRRADAPDDDMTLGDTLRGVGGENSTVTRSFTHAVEPIELTVFNGKYYINPATVDTVWCNHIAHDTVAVFLHPDLEVTGDTIVCQGSRTDATVRALGVDGCTYQWYTTLYGSSSIATGANLQVVPYADVSTYYVKVTSPQGCVAWDSIHAYLVRPSLTMRPEDGRICPGDTVRLFGADADHFTWTASPEDPSLVGQDSNASIKVLPQETTIYTMVGHGSNDCDASPLTKTVTVIPMPVPRVETDPAIVDTDDPTVTLRDVSKNSVGSSWLFADGTTVEGAEVTHTFDEAIGTDSVRVVLTTRNELGCSVDYRFGILVNLYTAWVPNIFTPGSDDGNATFRLYTINKYEYFHIYIYNRRGEVVFESDNPDFEWDGTCDGRPVPQGAYVYICRYRKPGMNTLADLRGTVTLIR